MCQEQRQSLHKLKAQQVTDECLNNSQYLQIMSDDHEMGQAQLKQILSSQRSNEKQKEKEVKEPNYDLSPYSPMF